MNLGQKILKTTIMASSVAMLLSGCSLKNPFGIGYDTSVSEETKDFGVSGSPKDIYKYRDQIRQVQKDYLNSGLEQELFFAIDQEGNIKVKADRDGTWERYDISKWKEIIDADLKDRQAKIDELKKSKTKKGGKSSGSGEERSANFNSIQSDLTVTEETDLSIRYQDQGPLLVTRTKVGDIIRDNGLIQQVFVSNYVDNSGDLVSSHELFVVVKDPEWIVGEKTPKNSKINDLPTPISKELLDKEQRSSAYEERVVSKYNVEDKAGVVEAVANDPIKQNKENKQDMDLINSFIK